MMRLVMAVWIVAALALGIPLGLFLVGKLYDWLDERDMAAPLALVCILAGAVAFVWACLPA